MTTKIFCFHVPGLDEDHYVCGVAMTETGRECGRMRGRTLAALRVGMALEPAEGVRRRYDRECPGGWTVEWIERGDPRPDLMAALDRFDRRVKNYRVQKRAHEARGRATKPPAPAEVVVSLVPTMAVETQRPRDLHIRAPWCPHSGNPVSLLTGKPLDVERSEESLSMCARCGTWHLYRSGARQAVDLRFEQLSPDEAARAADHARVGWAIHMAEDYLRCHGDPPADMARAMYRATLPRDHPEATTVRVPAGSAELTRRT